MARNPAGSPKARNLGAELRKAREDVGITALRLAQKLEVSRARLQRWENGTTVPTPAEVASYLTYLNINGAERDRVVQLADEVDAGNWTTSDTSGARTELTTLIETERTCTEMVNVAPLLIPGLLQTDEYIRAVMGDLDDVENRVHLRLGRQSILTKRRNAPRYSVFISEWVLREPIGGPAVMADQLRHIVDMAKRENISVRVIPSGARTMHPAHAGMFVLFRFPKASPIVHLEHYGPASFLYNTKDVAIYERAEEVLRTVALSEAESASLMAKIATEMEQEEG
ncbi:helix-turn-helix domain-containing protein [Saccharopolyspora elongata]|uniref:XRE family transcriptional regulator n=1 Tax=Saccharopolyspora elongata TaxID=2530387 RepID=A0A4R4YBX3_9PSEU|nr:helix-turn-helix transcriptional regulator [Saccharopolyspora elongata]TDD41354.1 XRE family transcriptional regulator [Saccharopolyspora elongata]